MPTLLLYLLVVLIWGTTWFAIKFQLGVVAPEVSLVYRFGIAAACLFLFGRMVRSPMKLAPADHAHVLLQALGLFCINYWLTYLGTVHLTTGLVAVLFTAIIFMNLVNARLIFGTPVEGRVLGAAGVGLGGVALLFWPELRAALAGETRLIGPALVLGGTYVASLGNMAAMRNTAAGLPVMTVNAYGMVYGAAGLALLALLRGQPFDFEASFSYIASLLYLSVMGSAVAFGCYLALIKRIGASRAAYSSVMFPAVALLVSTLFEDYRWSLPALLGLAVMLGGNALALSHRGGGLRIRAWVNGLAARRIRPCSRIADGSPGPS